MEELIAYYKRQGAPQDQNALIALLKELQQMYGSVPSYMLPEIAKALEIKESFLLAVVRRIPSLRLDDHHLLEICAGPNCGKSAAVAAFAEKHLKGKCQIKYVGCMRLCGKGPNVKYDGKLYHKADEALLRSLTDEERKL